MYRAHDPFVVAAVLTGLLAAPAVGASWNDAVPGSYLQERSVFSPVTGAGDDFSYAVAVGSDGTLLVGAPLGITNGTDSGIAYVYDAGRDEPRLTLTSPTPDHFDSFGKAVAIAGNSLAVGAYGDDTVESDAGAVYLFDRASGVLQRSLFAPPSYRLVGWELAAYGNHVFAASRSPGAVHEFDANTGAFIRSFVPPSGGDVVSVVVTENYVIAGSIAGTYAPDREGAVIVFDRLSGAPLQTLTHPSQSGYTGWGTGLAFAGSRVFVGASSDNSGASQSGAVYVFDVNTGALERTILNPDPNEFRFFGTRVGYVVDPRGRERLLVAAPISGLLYVFDMDGRVVQVIGAGNVSAITPAGGDFFIGSWANRAVAVFAFDSDDDGLSDRAEGRVGTDVLNPDSDGDGLTDGQEVISLGTNPLAADTDADGLNDLIEVTFGVTAPTVADSDGDGVVDGRDTEWLQAYFDALPSEVFTGPRPALRVRLDEIERLIVHDQSSAAIRELSNLTIRFDGCGVAADPNDWIADCHEQRIALGYLTLLQRNLTK